MMGARKFRQYIAWDVFFMNLLNDHSDVQSKIFSSIKEIHFNSRVDHLILFKHLNQSNSHLHIRHSVHPQFPRKVGILRL